MNRRIACLTLGLATIGCGSASDDAPGTPPAISGGSNGGGGSINLGRADAGASLGTTNGNGGTTGTQTAQGREYGVGDYAVILTGAAAPPRFCWYTEVTTQVCDGSPPTKRTFADYHCVDGGLNCLANEPADQERETSSCWTRIDYDTVGRDALFGSCATLSAYKQNYLSGACMFHKHCPGGKCVDYHCTGENYHLPGAPGPGPGTMNPQPMSGGNSPDALPGTSSPDAQPMINPDPTPMPMPMPMPTPSPPDASPPPAPPGPPGGGPAPPMR